MTRSHELSRSVAGESTSIADRSVSCEEYHEDALKEPSISLSSISIRTADSKYSHFDWIVKPSVPAVVLVGDIPSASRPD
jgi:hypothetical protein